MLSYCLKSRKNTESKNSKFVKTKNGRMIILSNYVVCNSKKSRFIKEQEASGLLSGPNSPLRKTNEIINNFLLSGEKFMPKMHLREPRFTYSVCGHFAKNKAPMQKFKEAGDSKYIYQNELYKACFQHDIAYEDFKDLPSRTIADTIVRNKAFDIAKKLEVWRISMWTCISGL